MAATVPRARPGSNPRACRPALRIDRYRAGDPETGAPWPSADAAPRPFGGSLEAAIRAAALLALAAVAYRTRL